LREDLAAIDSWGAGILVSLIEGREYRLVGVEHMPELLPRHILHINLPIEDESIPDSGWEESWRREGPRVRGFLAHGGRVCVHCMGGFGRTGLLAARILVEFGERPEQAIRFVRATRPGTIETGEQEEYVKSIADRLES
jgi:protein-tyrosine phosphatase